MCCFSVFHCFSTVFLKQYYKAVGKASHAIGAICRYGVLGVDGAAHPGLTTLPFWLCCLKYGKWHCTSAGCTEGATQCKFYTQCCYIVAISNQTEQSGFTDFIPVVCLTQQDVAASNCHSCCLSCPWRQGQDKPIWRVASYRIDTILKHIGVHFPNSFV